jgi:hypothetical protein
VELDEEGRFECERAGVSSLEERLLSIGEKNVLSWYARTPKSPPFNPLFLALPRSKINTAFR